MTTYIHELAPDSHKLTFDNPPTAQVKWVCEGEFSAYEVGVLARTTTPTQYLHPLGILYRNGMEVDEVGYRVYHITVHYGHEKIPLGSYRIEFDTLGGTTHVKGGVHLAVYPNGEPTHDGLIGVKGDDVEGSDIVIPAMRIIVHYSHEVNYLTTEKVRQLSRLSGCVDNAGFLGWDAYETLFLGAQGSQTNEVSNEGTDVTTEVSYHFAMSENRFNFQIAGISGIDKHGWDVAWVKWREAVESGKASNEAEYVNVVKVYRDVALAAALEFG